MGLVITILIAALVYWLLAALTVPLVGIVGAIVVLLAGVPSGSYRGRW